MPTDRWDKEVRSTEEARTFIDELHSENEAFYSDDRGRGALNTLQQTFQKWHYIAELLQNAIDERARRIRLAISDGSLTFEHDGNPFTACNVRGLCTKGVSSKGAATVGFMGIGFKAVFHSFTSAGVSSGRWRFALTVPRIRRERYGDEQIDWLGCVLPRWNDTLLSPSSGMTCRFTFSGRCRREPLEEDLRHVFGDDHALLALLAWREVEEVEWAGQRWQLSRKLTELGDGDRRVLLTACTPQGTVIHQWILFDREYQPSNHAIRRFLEHRQIAPEPEEEEAVYAQAARQRQVAVFCELHDGRPGPPDRGTVFALLPTGVTLPLGVHLQADWLLDTSRQELIQRDDNAWHDEIRDQLPRLLRRVLEWMIELAGQRISSWEEAYKVLPGERRPEQHNDPWLDHDSFRKGLAAELGDLAFLPLPPAPDGPPEFCRPDDARILPGPLAEAFDEDLSDQRRLFGSRVISAQLLGRRATRCLERLELLIALRPKELAKFWTGGEPVAGWLAARQEDERDKDLDRLLQALAVVDEEDEAWKQAELTCLPTQAGKWTHRNSVARYPADWDVIRSDPTTCAALEPLVGVGKPLLDWRFDSYLRRVGPGEDYIRPIAPEKLEDVVGRWWAALPEQPTDEESQLFLHFTNWVRDKLSARPRLVQKVLCHEKGKRKRLLPCDQALLTDPYAGKHRRHFFPDLPAVIKDYLDQDEDATAVDWLAFLNRTGAKGAFFLQTTERILRCEELQARVGGNYIPPTLRTTQVWGVAWSNWGYELVDWGLPNFVAEKLQKHDWSVGDFKHFQLWLDEASAKGLEASAFCKISYYGQRQQTATEAVVPRRAAWWRQLRRSRWIYTGDGQGPYRVADVLPPGAPAEDGAPIAEMSLELIDKLQQVGFVFRKPLADAPPIERLRVLGPTADVPQLVALLDAAAEEAMASEGAGRQFASVLEQPLLPGGTRRYAYSQVVRQIRSGTPRGTNLAGFLLAVDSLDESLQEALRRVEQVKPLSPIPEAVGGLQVIQFLQNTWQRAEAASQRLPDEDPIKQVMPRAYSYLVEDLEDEAQGSDESNAEKGTLRAAWEQAMPLACVFIGSRWVPVAEAMLDDLGDEQLRRQRPKQPWATGGYLGPTLPQQQRVAQELELRLLSEEVIREPHPGPEITTLDARLWRERFALIAAALNQCRQDEGHPKAKDSEAPATAVELSVVQSLFVRTEWADGSVAPSEVVITAFVQTGGDEEPALLYVTGRPEDFAPAAADVLVSRASVWNLRGDSGLAIRLASLLHYLGDEARFSRALQDLCQRYSIEVPATPSPAPPIQAEGDESEAAPQQDTSGEPEGDEEPGNGGQQAELIPGGNGQEDPGSGEGGGTGGRRTGDTSGAGGRKTNGGSGGGGAASRRSGGSSKEGSGWVPWAFVNPEGGDGSPREKRDDARGREAVLEYERQHNRQAEEKDKQQEGYDVASFDPGAGITRRIEVKGIHDWLACPVYMTRAQFRDSFGVPPTNVEYWLYVVDHANSDRPRVLGIRTAAQRVERFYLDARAWRERADEQGEVDLPLPALIDDDPVPPEDDAPAGPEDFE